MNNCLFCEKPVNNKYCNVSCQNSHQGEKRANTRYGVLKEFSVKCFSCDKEVIISERERLFPKKDRYFCSRKCANSSKIRNFTKKMICSLCNNEVSIDIRSLKSVCKECLPVKKKKLYSHICKNCSKNFTSCSKNQKFCTRSCAIKKCK